MVEQVGGEEERKEQLGELARLELAQSRNPMCPAEGNKFTGLRRALQP